MKLQDILKEIMGVIREDNTNNVDWLINWFKNVPEEKLEKTFTTTDNQGKVRTMTRDEIIKVLSDKSNVVIITDPSEKEQLGLNVGLGMFLNKYHGNRGPVHKKYAGKVVISGDWKNIIKTDPMYKDVKGLNGVKHHEQTHLIQHRQSNFDKKKGYGVNDKSQWHKTISGYCKPNTSPFCKEETGWGFGYYERPEEIYSHLFTIREFLGIQPMDLVTYADARIKNKVATINVSVYRDGKVIQLPTKTMGTDSSTFITIYCCNKSFKSTLIFLNNTLAKIENGNSSTQNQA